MKLSLTIFALLFLAGCAEYNAAKQSVVQVKRVINDEQYNGAVQVVCRDAAIGAIRRKYDDDFSRWMVFCAKE